MKTSRLFVIITFLMVALFAGGAILGSLIPETIWYLGACAVSIALALYGLWFYYGQKKDENIGDEENNQ